MCAIEPSLCRGSVGPKSLGLCHGVGALLRHSVLSKSTMNAPKSLPWSFPKATHEEKAPKNRGSVGGEPGIGLSTGSMGTTRVQ